MTKNFGLFGIQFWVSGKTGSMVDGIEIRHQVILFIIDLWYTADVAPFTNKNLY